MVESILIRLSNTCNVMQDGRFHQTTDTEDNSREDLGEDDSQLTSLTANPSGEKDYYCFFT
jgi:hypothetical protein